MLEIKEIRIGDKVIDEITDEDGVKWYPFKHFLNRILCKYDKISSFRDSDMARYMKVFTIKTNKPHYHTNVSMWCMNERGIKTILKNTTVNRVHRKDLFESREKGLYEACRYFDVKPLEELDPIFLNVPPKNLKGYDTWSLLCLENDFKLDPLSKWKRCTKCNYYYPYGIRYFGEKMGPNSKCLQCQGKEFKCQNKVIQFLYDHGGLTLLAELEGKKYELVVMELRKMIKREGPDKDAND